ncbi:hypothetical protein RAS1_43020 [Phycisphaerae bacterium RAS1]|nr:hypothetical protein RAS1_43020 [Phycisphaerae bacterium RAS1]
MTRFTRPAILTSGLIWLAAAAHGQTVDQCKKFFKDLDDHTLRRTGVHVIAIYGRGAEAEKKLMTDMFNGVSSAAQRAIANLATEAHGGRVKAKDADYVTSAVKKLKEDEVLKRISKLQLSVMKDHIGDGAGGVDLTKMHKAFELFANGELRAGGAGTGEMDQLHQFAVWVFFAKFCIDNDVDKAEWTSLMKDLQYGAEIYARVYPAPRGNGRLGILYDSKAACFNADKQLNADAKKKLWDEIKDLTPDKLVDRLKARLKEWTNDDNGRGADEGDEAIQRVAVEQVWHELTDGGYMVYVEMRVTDLNNQPVTDADVEVTLFQAAIEGSSGAIAVLLDAQNDLDGRYTAAIFMPALVETGDGYTVQAFEWVGATTSIGAGDTMAP